MVPPALSMSMEPPALSMSMVPLYIKKCPEFTGVPPHAITIWPLFVIYSFVPFIEIQALDLLPLD
jgi:hypothetical protein